jgi:hypothetical protein
MLLTHILKNCINFTAKTIDILHFHSEGKLFPGLKYHAMKVYRGTKVNPHALLISAPDGGVANFMLQSL